MKIKTLTEYHAALERAESLMDTEEAAELLELAEATVEYEAPWFEEMEEKS